MILLQSTHNAQVKALESKHLAEKEELRQLYFAHLQTLEARVEDLKALVFSSTSASNVPLVHLEADAIMSQKDEITEVTREEAEKQEFILRERDRIFAGEHEESL